MSNGLTQAIKILYQNWNSGREVMPRYISVPGGKKMNTPPNYDQLVDELLMVDDYGISGRELATISSQLPDDGPKGKMFISDLLKRAAVNDIPVKRRRVVYMALNKLHLDEGKGAADDNNTKDYLLSLENTDTVVIDLMTAVWGKYFREFPEALEDMPNYVKAESALDMMKYRNGSWMIPEVIKGKRQSLYHLRYTLKHSQDISEEARRTSLDARIR